MLEDRVQNVNMLFTNGTSYNVIQHSVNVLERRGCFYNSLWICIKNLYWLAGACTEVSPVHVLVHDGRAHALLVWSWDYVFAWPPWGFHQMCVYHCRILDLRFDRKRQTTTTRWSASRHPSSGWSDDGTTSFRKALQERSFEYCRPSNDFPWYSVLMMSSW